MANETLSMMGSTPVAPGGGIDAIGSMRQGAALGMQQTQLAEEQTKQYEHANDTAAWKSYVDQNNGMIPATPDEWTDALRKVGPKVSPDSFLKMSEMVNKIKTDDAKFKSYIAEANIDHLKWIDASQAHVDQAVKPALDAYDEALKKAQELTTDPVVQKARAKEIYKAAVIPALQQLSQLKNADGTPALSPDQIKAYGDLDPDHAKQMFHAGQYSRALVDNEVKRRQEAAKALQEEATAQEKTARAGIEEETLSRMKSGKPLPLDPNKMSELGKDLALAGIDPASPEGQKIIRDRIKKLDAPARGSSGGGTGNAGPTEGNFSKTGEDFLATLPASDRQLIKKIASYEIDPGSLSMKGGHREQILKQVAQYDPTYQQSMYKNLSTAERAWMSGKDAETVKTFSTAVLHLNTLEDAADALKNGNIPIFNQIANKFADMTGQPAPNNFEAVKQLISAEVAKSIVGGQTGVADREHAAAVLANWKSPEQTAGVIAEIRDIMGGQLSGLEQKYKNALKKDDFREKLIPEAQQVYDEVQKGRKARMDRKEAEAKPAAAGAPKVTGIASKAELAALIKAGKLKSDDTFTDINGQLHKVK